MDKILKAKHWFARAAIIVAIFAILITLLPKLPSNWSLGSLASLFGEKQVTTKTHYLEAGEWSNWITTPAESDYRIDVSVPVEVCFIDDPHCEKTVTVYPSEYNEPTWFGVRRGIFKLWSWEPTKVDVTIER